MSPETIYDGVVVACTEILLERYPTAIATATVTETPLELEHEQIQDANPEVAADLLDEPEMTRPSVVEAVQVTLELGITGDTAERYATRIETEPDALTDALLEAADAADVEIDPREPISDLVPPVRLCGLPEARTFDVGEFDPDDVMERLVALRGQATKRGDKQLRDDIITFECQLCGTRTEVVQSGRAVQEPHECTGCERQGPWTTDDRASSFTNYQQLRFQALPEHTGSTDTATIDVELTDDLVGTVNPGDRAIINATIAGDRINDTRIRELYARADSVELIETSHDDIEWETRLDEIKEIVDSDSLFEDIVDSIAPDHHGDRELKLALAMAVFGGVKKHLPDGSTKRGNSHIIIIGDPGTGKSGLLEYITHLVPRSEFATGNQTTSAGLTAAAVQDDFGGDGWTLEAGTLVRANGGVACIDELDKMSPQDRGGLMEAMSEQQISIHKAASGTLPAETTVVAAANPEYGSFNPSEPIGTQLAFETVLLSRFDLWFVIQDEPHEGLDADVAEHMNTTTRVGQEIAADPEAHAGKATEVDPEIPIDLFRAYVAHARTLTPILTDEAAALIKSDYIDLRQANGNDGPVPVTARSIEAVHRLAEASARMRLSEEVREEDVKRAINIRDFCFETMGIDPETGELDALRLETGVPTSQHERIKHVTDVIRRLCRESDDGVAARAAVKEECMAAMDEDEFEHTLEEQLLRPGKVIQPSTNTLRLA